MTKEPPTVVMGIMCVRCRTKLGAILANCNPHPVLEGINANILCSKCGLWFLEKVKKEGVVTVNLRSDGGDPFEDFR